MSASRPAASDTSPIRMSAAAWAGLCGVALLWGGSFPAIRIAVAEVPVITLVAIRVGGAALILLATLRAIGVRLPRAGRDWAALAIQAQLNYVIPFLSLAWGQQYITAGLASILNASTAVFAVLIASLFLRDERLTGQRLAGVALGLVGVIVAMGFEALRALDLSSLAQLALLGASLSYALANIWGRAKTRHIDPRVVAASTLSLGALVLVPLALVVDGVPPQLWSVPALGSMAYLAILSTALAYFLYFRVLAMAGAGNASLVTLLVVPVAIVLGAVLLGEQLALRDYVGFALLALGLMVIDGRIRITR